MQAKKNGAAAELAPEAVGRALATTPAAGQRRVAADRDTGGREVAMVIRLALGQTVEKVCRLEACKAMIEEYEEGRNIQPFEIRELCREAIAKAEATQ